MPSSVTVGRSPSGLAISPDGATLYVVNISDSSVSKIDTASFAVTGTVTDTTNLGGSTGETLLAPDGGKFFVAESDQATVIGTSTLTVVGETTPSGPQCLALAMAPDGSALYMCAYNTGTSSRAIFSINLTTYATTYLLDVPNGAQSMTVSADGSKLYVGNNADGIVVINTTTNTVTSTTATGGSGTSLLSLTLSPDGTKLYFGDFAGYDSGLLVMDTTALTFTQFTPGASAANYYYYAVGFSSDGTQGFAVDYGRALTYTFDVTTHAVTNTILTNGGDVDNPNSAAFSSDGKTIYTCLSSGTVVSNTTDPLRLGAAESDWSVDWADATLAVLTPAPLTGESDWSVDWTAAVLSLRSPATLAGESDWSVDWTAAVLINAPIVPIGTNPVGIALSSDGNTLYAVDDGGVNLIDAITMKLTSFISSTASPDGQVALTPDGSKLFVPTGSGLDAVDLSTSTATAVTGVTGITYTVIVSSDGTTAYSAAGGGTDLWVIHVASDTVTSTLSLAAGTGVDYIAMSPDGTTIFAAVEGQKIIVVDVSTLSVTATIDTSSWGSYFTQQAAITPDGTKLIVSTVGGTEAYGVMDTSTHGLSTFTPVTASYHSYWGIGFSTDGTVGWAVNYYIGQTYLFDPSTMAVIKTIATDGLSYNNPTVAVMSHDNSTLYATIGDPSQAEAYKTDLTSVSGPTGASHWSVDWAVATLDGLSVPLFLTGESDWSVDWAAAASPGGVRPKITLAPQSPTPPALLDSIAARIVSVQVWNGNSFIQEIPITTGSVTIDQTAVTRRTHTLTVADQGIGPDNPGSLVPELPTDLLHPLSQNELHIFRGFRYDDGTEALYSLGVFPMTKPLVTDQGTDIQMTINGNDRSVWIASNVWTQPYVITAGADLARTVIDLLNDRWSGPSQLDMSRIESTSPIGHGKYGAGLNIQLPATTFGADPSSTNNPWSDIQTLCLDAAGMDLYFDWDGRPVMESVLQPSLAGVVPVMKNLYEEDSGQNTMTKATMTYDETATYSGVVAIGNGSGTDPNGIAVPPVTSRSVSPTDGLTYIGVWDTNPKSNVYYDPGNPRASRIGPRAHVITTQAIPGFNDTEATAQIKINAVAAAQLQFVLSAYLAPTFECVPNPAVHENDVVTLVRKRAGINGEYILQAMTIPLDVSTAMSVTLKPKQQAGV